MRNAKLFAQLVVLTAALTANVSAATLNTLVTFDGTNGTGAHGLIADASGNLYGTTAVGPSGGTGTIFKIAAGTNTLTTIGSFTGTTNGSNPGEGLILDASGNIYGTTSQGGSTGNGTIYKLAAGASTPTALVNFNTFTSGNGAIGPLLTDASGNFYGTTIYGGPSNKGTVFKFSPDTNTFTTLVKFNSINGENPNGGLIADASGNLYGTTPSMVFKVAAGTNTLTTLATFTYTNGNCLAGLISDAAGNFFGTTGAGGPTDDGTVFELVAGSNTITTLATFNRTNGRDPVAGLIEDAAGNLFGTTKFGGSTGDLQGTVFEVAAGSNTITTLAAFTGPNGDDPVGRLIADAQGNLFGTTYEGGPSMSANGTVFELTNSGFVVAPEPSSLALISLGIFPLLRRSRAGKVRRETKTGAATGK